MPRRYGNRAVFTSLTTALAANGAETTIAVGDTTGWPAPGAGDTAIGAIDIGDQGLVEIFSYTGLTATSFTGVTRGLDGTTQPAHTVGAKVRHVASAADIESIGTKQALSEKGIANGYASLDAGGDVPASQLGNAAGVSAEWAQVDTGETTTSTSFADLATAGPAATVTIGAAGKALVTISATAKTSGADEVYAGFAVSGASTVGASLADAISFITTHAAGETRSFTMVISGLTAGSTTFTMKYRVAGAMTATFKNRNITVIPL